MKPRMTREACNLAFAALLLSVGSLPLLYCKAPVVPEICELPPEAEAILKTAFPAWSVLEYSHLGPNEQELLSSRCPGLARGGFKGPDEIGYAVVVARAANGKRESRLVYMEEGTDGYEIEELRLQDDPASYAVVHREPPGLYRNFYDRGDTITAKNDVIVFEILEATATVFYFDSGRFRELLISD